MRLDKWLVQARFFRTRGLASAVIEAGHVRLNGQHVVKPAQPAAPGDTLSFPQGGWLRLIRVVALGTRRGPSAEAATLYIDLDAPPAAASPLE